MAQAHLQSGEKPTAPVLKLSDVHPKYILQAMRAVKAFKGPETEKINFKPAPPGAYYTTPSLHHQNDHRTPEEETLPDTMVINDSNLRIHVNLEDFKKNITVPAKTDASTLTDRLRKENGSPLPAKETGSDAGSGITRDWKSEIPRRKSTAQNATVNGYALGHTASMYSVCYDDDHSLITENGYDAEIEQTTSPTGSETGRQCGCHLCADRSTSSLSNKNIIRSDVTGFATYRDSSISRSSSGTMRRSRSAVASKSIQKVSTLTADNKDILTMASSSSICPRVLQRLLGPEPGEWASAPPQGMQPSRTQTTPPEMESSRNISASSSSESVFYQVHHPIYGQHDN